MAETEQNTELITQQSRQNTKKQDLLDRTQFVNSLVQAVRIKAAQKQGFSLAVNGDWGCGKTFVLNMLQEQLQSDSLIFHYNCWENDFYEEPLMALLSVFIDTLNTFDTEETRFKAVTAELKKQTKETLELVARTLAKHITGIDFEAFIQSVKQSKKRIKEFSCVPKDFDTSLPLKSGIDKVKEQLKALNEKVPVLIIVDELDRCLPAYAIKVLERLHHILHGEPFIQIIAVDKIQLAHSIADAFGRRFDKKNELIEFTSRYLQKFVDAELTLDRGTPSKEVIRIFGGFENRFTENMNGTADILTAVITELNRHYNFTMRQQQHIAEKIILVHKLTETVPDEQYDLSLLCAELIIMTVYLNDPGPLELLPIKGAQNSNGEYSLQIDNWILSCVRSQNGWYTFYTHPELQIFTYFYEYFEKPYRNRSFSLDRIQQEYEFFARFKTNMTLLR